MSDTDIPTPVAPSSDPAFPAEAGLSVSSGLTPGFLGPSWQEQDGALRDMWLQNKTPQDISLVLNRSIAAIMTRAARLGLPRRAAPGRKPGSRRILPGLQSEETRAAMRSTARPLREGEIAPQSSARVCLMCLRSFQSQGRHNRICSSCKGSSEYESATALADIHFPV